MNDSAQGNRQTNTYEPDPSTIAIGTKEAARRLGVHRNTLYKWVQAKLIPHKRVGDHIVFSVKRLEAWAADEGPAQFGSNVRTNS